MNSNKKPPLPNNISLSEKRPELFCLNCNKTKNQCDEYNINQTVKNQEIWDDFHKKLVLGNNL